MSLLNRHRLAMTVKLILGAPLAGAVLPTHAADADRDAPILAVVRVEALALDEDLQNVPTPFSLLEDQKLFERAQATLGDTLNGLPGVHSDTFGGGAARPVIRGQTAPRIKVLSDGGALLDASDISPDHAVTAEPFLIGKLEVLRGPATLLYGSGAIGGVVNVLDKKIPTKLPESGLTGSAAARTNSAARERAAMLEMTGQASDRLVWHLEGTARDAHDYRAPGLSESRVDGTHAESSAGSAGLSWVADNGFIGLAYSYRDDDYGLPGHNHEYEGCHPHGSALHCGGHDVGDGGHDHGHDHGEAPSVALLSKRLDLRGEINDPFAGVERIRVRASHTDYRHDELEGDEVSTTFRNQGADARVEVQHTALLGFRGVIGAQYANTTFGALGAEAFIPTADSETTGIFAVEHFALNDAWRFEAGARQEWQKHRPVNDPRRRPARSDSGASFSTAAIWEVSPTYFLALSASRSERLPHVQELYARGIHLATNTYECGLVRHPLTCGGLTNNAEIDTETSNNVELSLRKAAGELTFALSAFHNKVDDYIYARTLDQFEDFRLIKYTQRDAEFTGAEAEISYQITQHFAATAFGDYVRAKLTDGANLPRIPAARYGMRLSAALGSLGGELEYYRVKEQDDIAAYEASTPGYDMLNLIVSVSPRRDARYSVYLRGGNLLDEEVWNHASFLAKAAPLPGRSLSAGVKLSF